MLVGASAIYCSDEQLKLTITPDKQLYYIGAPVIISYRLQNISEKPVKVLTLCWDEYFNLFDIKDEQGKEIKHRGPRIEMILPTEKDYITIKSGEFIERTYRLDLYYDLKKPGKYSIMCNN